MFLWSKNDNNTLSPRSETSQSDRPEHFNQNCAWRIIMAAIKTAAGYFYDVHTSAQHSGWESAEMEKENTERQPGNIQKKNICTGAQWLKTRGLFLIRSTDWRWPWRPSLSAFLSRSGPEKVCLGLFIFFEVEKCNYVQMFDMDMQVKYKKARNVSGELWKSSTYLEKKIKIQ